MCHISITRFYQKREQSSHVLHFHTMMNAKRSQAIANSSLLIGTTPAVRGVSTGCKECDYRIKETISVS